MSIYGPELESAPEVYRSYIATRNYFGGIGFAPTHFYTPEELKAEFRNKTEILKMIGLEGMFSTHEKEYNEIYKIGKFNKILWETQLKTCTDPSIPGISEHFMIICRKK